MATFPPPTVPVFPAGYGPYATDFTTWWYDNASFFQNRVVFRASQTTTATTLPSSSAHTTIGYDNVIEDPYSGWSAGTFMWTPPTGYSGWYQATITVRTVTPATLVDLRVFLAGTYTYLLGGPQGSAATGGAGVCGTMRVYLVGGQDGLGAAAAVFNSGSNVNTSLTAGLNSTLEIVWLSQT